MGTKVTDLTELTATAASGDFLHIIDVDDNSGGSAGTSKKIQISNLLRYGCSERDTDRRSSHQSIYLHDARCRHCNG